MATAPRPSAKTRTPRKPAAKAPAGAAPAPAAANKGEALLRAGLKALGEVRDGVVQRQTRAVETLLGDSLGFRKLEDVFDQRIAAALERLGYPSAEALRALSEAVCAVAPATAKVAPTRAAKATRSATPARSARSTQAPKAPRPASRKR